MKLSICLFLFWIGLNIAKEVQSLNLKAASSAQRLLPVHGADPVLVDVSLMVMFIGEYDILTMDFELDLFILMNWSVDQILCDNDTEKIVQAGLTPPRPDMNAVVPPEIIDDFWLPDIYIREAKDVKMSSDVVPTMSLKIRQKVNSHTNESDGCRYYLKTRQQSYINCPGDFRRYPFDIQRCPINLRSWAFGDDDLVLAWKGVRKGRLPDSSFQVEPTMQMLEYSVHYAVGYSADPHWTQRSETWNLTYTKNNYIPHWTDDLMPESFIGVKFVVNFRRRFTYQFLNMFLPAFLLVVVASSSFAMHISSSTGRIQLTATVLLSLYTMINNFRLTLPKTSYMTYSDVFLCGCVIFVVAIIIETAVIEKMYKAEDKKSGSNAQNSQHDGANQRTRQSLPRGRFQQRTSRLQKSAVRTIVNRSHVRSSFRLDADHQQSRSEEPDPTFIIASSTIASFVGRFIGRFRVARQNYEDHQPISTSQAQFIDRIASYVVCSGLIAFLVLYFASVFCVGGD